MLQHQQEWNLSLKGEIECNMNQQVGVFEEGSTLTKISDFVISGSKKSDELASV
jgi:hypothetical protein